MSQSNTVQPGRISAPVAVGPAQAVAPATAPFVPSKIDATRITLQPIIDDAQLAKAHRIIGAATLSVASLLGLTTGGAADLMRDYLAKLI